MKKIFLSIIVIVAFLAISSQVIAQGIGIGVKAGANFANQSISNIDTKSKTGFHGGAYVILAFSDKWAIQPELLYSGQGSEWPSSTAQFDYMSIPVLLRYKPISLLSFEAGPQFSTLLSAKVDGDNVKDQIKNSDFGLAVGATVHLPLGFNGGLRYVWGFTNVSEFSTVSEVKNTMVQLFVGWTILGAN